MTKRYTVKLTADHNDGNYVTTEFEIKEKELLNLKLIAELRNRTNGNIEQFFELARTELTEELFDWFFEDHFYFSGQPDGAEMHTFVSIEYTPVITWKKL